MRPETDAAESCERADKTCPHPKTCDQFGCAQEKARLSARIAAFSTPQGTLGQLRELTADLSDDTPLVVVIRKEHDPDYFYEPVLVESYPHVDLTGVPQVILTAPEPRDLNA